MPMKLLTGLGAALALLIVVVLALILRERHREVAPAPAVAPPSPRLTRPPLQREEAAKLTINSPGVLPYEPARTPPPLEGPLDRSFEAKPTSDPRIARHPSGKPVINEAVTMGRGIAAPNRAARNRGDRDAALVQLAERDMSTVEDILRIFRLHNLENPVGENDEIMRALMGENRRNLVFFPADHAALDGIGRLLDPWGNPYFFHAVTQELMDVWSSGPDGFLGTPDDLKLYGEELEPGESDLIGFGEE